nr:formimidoylglutamate deiminase [Sphingomonas sp. ID1715]
MLLESALLPQGWARDVLVTLQRGTILSVSPDHVSSDLPVERVSGVALPGMINAHSHAFQRAFAGLAERRGGNQDSFWTWRDAMYRAAAQLTPEMLHAIAAQLYAEMLAAGYTSVCEFHYVHHRADGQPHAPASAMAQALIAAAQETGIGLTLLPVLYQTSGFGGRPPRKDQRRFINDVDALLRIIGEAQASAPSARVGLALHSLRAVPPEALEEAVAAIDRAAPIHIHVAEQVAEVEDCVAWSARRPVEWLLDEAEVDARWTLVHATHLSDAEVERLALSGATVALCPTTEANLGDGLFPLLPYLERGGGIAIGSDSHVSVDPLEELRWLEYSQRLTLQRRSLVTSEAQPHPGAELWRRALAGGAAAAGNAVGSIAPGARADLVIIDPDHASLLTEAGDAMLDTLVFSTGARAAVRRVMAGGQWVVTEGRHERQSEIAKAYAGAVRSLRQALA